MESYIDLNQAAAMIGSRSQSLQDAGSNNVFAGSNSQRQEDMQSIQQQYAQIVDTPV